MTVIFAVESDIVALEHVVLIFNMHFLGQHYEYYDYNQGDQIFSQWQERGTVRVDLTSPSGTTSTLLPFRPGDMYPGSYNNWPLMTVHFWGENATGNWTLMVTYAGVVGAIRVELPEMTLYGTSEVPEAVSSIPAQCSSECDPTRGCAASGAEFCDACAQLRLASTLQCVSSTSCPEGLTERNGYCYDATMPECPCPFPVPPDSEDNSPSGASSSLSPAGTIQPTSQTTVPKTRTAVPCSSVIPTQTATPTPTTAPDKSTAVLLNPSLSMWVTIAMTLFSALYVLI